MMQKAGELVALFNWTCVKDRIIKYLSVKGGHLVAMRRFSLAGQTKDFVNSIRSFPGRHWA